MVVHANSSIWQISFWKHVKFQPGFLLAHPCSCWKHASYKVRCTGCGGFFGCSARWATMGLGFLHFQAAACEPGQVGSQRCEAAHQAAWDGAAVMSSFGEYFWIDEQNKFISGAAKVPLNAFSFLALNVDETRAGKLTEGLEKHFWTKLWSTISYRIVGQETKGKEGEAKGFFSWEKIAWLQLNVSFSIRSVNPEEELCWTYFNRFEP